MVQWLRLCTPESSHLVLYDNLQEWDRVGGGGRFRREVQYVYLQLIYFDIWQKPTL